jgi:hypothetical protein
MEQLIAPSELLITPKDLEVTPSNVDDLINKGMLIKVPDIRLENLEFFFAVNRAHTKADYVEFHLLSSDFDWQANRSVQVGLKAKFGKCDWEPEDKNMMGFTHSEYAQNLRFPFASHVGYLRVSCNPKFELDRIFVEIGWRFTYQIFSRFLNTETSFANGELNHQFGDTFSFNEYEIVVMEIDYENRIVYCGAIQGLK